MKGNFLPFLFRALTYTQGNFMLSRVLLSRTKRRLLVVVLALITEIIS